MTLKISQSDAETLILSVSNDVESVDFKEKKIWIKKVQKSKQKFGHRLQNFLTTLLHLKILGSTVAKKGDNHLIDQVTRLQNFKANGIYTPDVLYHNDTYIIMSDAGRTLQDTLKQTDDKEEQDALLKQATLTLANLHQKGLIHGRPYTKDIIYNEQTKEMGFIDLEEEPTKIMRFEEAQARDLWLFMGGISPYTEDDTPALQRYFEIYDKAAPQTYKKDLQKFIRFLKPINATLSLLFQDDVGKDILKAMRSTTMFVHYFKNQNT